MPSPGRFRAEDNTSAPCRFMAWAVGVNGGCSLGRGGLSPDRDEKNKKIWSDSAVAWAAQVLIFPSISERSG